MKGYNVKNWKEAFRFNRHDTLRSLLPLLILFGLYTFGVDWWLNHNLAYKEQPVLRNLGVVHGLLGFVISLLLVFQPATRRCLACRYGLRARLVPSLHSFICSGSGQAFEIRNP